MDANMEAGEFFPTDPELIELARKWDDAGFAYWKKYHEIRAGKPGAVLFLHNHENGHFMVFTRSEYVKVIKDYIIEAFGDMP